MRAIADVGYRGYEVECETGKLKEVVNYRPASTYGMTVSIPAQDRAHLKPSDQYKKVCCRKELTVFIVHLSHDLDLSEYPHSHRDERHRRGKRHDPNRPSSKRSPMTQIQVGRLPPGRRACWSCPWIDRSVHIPTERRPRLWRQGAGQGCSISRSRDGGHKDLRARNVCIEHAISSNGSSLIETLSVSKSRRGRSVNWSEAAFCKQIRFSLEKCCGSLEARCQRAHLE